MPAVENHALKAGLESDAIQLRPQSRAFRDSVNQWQASLLRVAALLWLCIGRRLELPSNNLNGTLPWTLSALVNVKYVVDFCTV